MKWQGINEFVAVAEKQSFSLAAKNLKISTAQVSRQITALEKRLQIKLFYRTTRKVSLTQEAQLFYQHCRHLLDDLDSAEQAITNLQSHPQGKIKLTAPMSYGEQKILPLVNDFVALYKDIEVVTELTSHRIDLIEGGFDMAIRMGQLQDSSLIARKLTQRATYVCASASYLQKHGQVALISDLKNHNCLLGTHDAWRFVEQGKTRSIKVTGSIRCNSGTGLVDAALKDIGIVQLSDYYLQPYIKSGQLIPILEQFREPESAIWAVYPQNRYLSPKIRLLIDYLAEHLN
ncbi:LysR family transcriptional regulator [Psychromonas marina]|uniref:LysR family transcriptional regulator n=1 Tax=Psychromonas marina TaxID=88364 RepID=A0ABQ6E1E1_9GAMM|nr:LysR substrate-binding domain-containing protein [Psychromonas marina]GLS91176.1 LysR family transcriptional regulator [Psychromonas marina]